MGPTYHFMWLALVVGCGGHVIGGDDDAQQDAAADGVTDVSPNTCSLDAAPPTVVSCDDDTKAACLVWAQSMVYGGIVYAQCIDLDAKAAVHGCTSSDACESNASGFISCSCGSLAGACVEGEVCVSDLPTTPAHHCVPACSQ